MTTHRADRGWLDEADLLAGLSLPPLVRVSYHSADDPPPTTVPHTAHTGHCPVCAHPVQFVTTGSLDPASLDDRPVALQCGHAASIRELLTDLPPEDVIRAVQGIYNCSRRAALVRIRYDRRRVVQALTQQQDRGVYSPDMTPTGKGDPLAQVYGATERVLAAIDDVLTD